MLGIFELIFQHLSQHLDFRSHHSPQLLLVIIILWISESPAKLVWDKPEPRRKRHTYFSNHLFSDLSYSHKNPSNHTVWNALNVWLLRSSHDKRWKQKTTRRNRFAVPAACTSFINTCADLWPYDFSFTEFSSPKGLISLTGKPALEFKYTATRWQSQVEDTETNQ